MLSLSNPDLLRNQAYANGQWIDGETGDTTEVFNPATGELVGSVPKLSAAQTREVITQADSAYRSWKKLTAKERCGLLRKWFDLITAHTDDIA